MKKIIQPKEKIFRTVRKTQYLKQILDRMDNEYVPIHKLVIEYNFEHERGMGFWSLIRMIFPVVETVSYVIGKQKEDFLTQDLGIPFGHIVWEIYRHSLMHGDELRYVVYKEKTIAWAVHLSTDDIGHIVTNQFDSQPTTIHISIPKFYSTLRDFLVKEVTKKDPSRVKIQVGVHFPFNSSKIIDELEEIYTKY